MPRACAGAASNGTAARCADQRREKNQCRAIGLLKLAMISLVMRELASAAPLAPPLWAARLGYAGLVPFVALALGLRFLPSEAREFCVFAVAAYAATITSFLGAIHWGLAMREAPSTSSSESAGAVPFMWGVVPSLVAWFALLSSPAVALLVLGVLLWVCYAVDKSVYPKFNLQSWLRMRLVLTNVASASCFYMAAGLLL